MIGLNRRLAFIFVAALCTLSAELSLSSPGVAARASGSGPAGQATDAVAATWKFAVSGDSRHCGDVVMPGIAAAVRQSGAAFYWHLGDFRAIYSFDEDIQHQPEHLAKPLFIADYEDSAWDDFIRNQLMPFGSLPVYLAIGNHETTAPKTRDQYLIQFADWLNQPVLRAQQLSNDGTDFKLKTYFHWE